MLFFVLPFLLSSLVNESLHSFVLHILVTDFLSPFGMRNYLGFLSGLSWSSLYKSVVHAQFDHCMTSSKFCMHSDMDCLSLLDRISIKMLTPHRRSIVRRSLFQSNVGGSESNPSIQGNDNQITYGAGTKSEEPVTLVQKAGHQVGRILEGGTEIVTAPAKWLGHMQDNWYVLSSKYDMHTDPLWMLSHCGRV